ncbi:MAG: T9SS type A sorting domain-containing protein [Bacteroidetes bacterium]|nr:T9SS type A sorting domain-containing protein [Bacteroidota bacterium]
MSAKKFKSALILLILVCCINQASAQWVQQNNPTGTFLDDVSFINDNTGWICGSGIAKTTNGGINWINLPNPESNVITNIHFIDANTGFAGSFYLWKTTNGGNNWTKALTDAGNYCDMSFINSSTGWVVSNSNGIWRTTDSGNNWTMINNQYNHTLNAISFINANTGWAAGYNGGIFKTTNGGVNWTAQTPVTTQDLYSINFSDANTGRAVGGNPGVFLRTTNGGTNWTSVAGPFNYRYDKTNFINSSIGWLSGASGIALTTDNGTSWINQTPPGSSNIAAVSYISPNTIYAVSQNVYKSTSGGFNLNAPSNLALVPVSTSQINLSWTDNSSDEEKFIIERSSDGNNWSIIDSVNADVTSYQSTGLSTDQLYYFRVYGKKIIFTSGYSSAEWIRTPMTAPTLSSPEAGTVIPYVPVLQWTTVPNAFTYTLQVASDTNFSNIVYTIIAPGLTSSPVPPANLQNSTRYYWRVKVSSLLNNSLFTPYRDFIFQNPNYGNNMSSGSNLYYFANSTSGANLSPNKPTYNWRDTTGSTYIILNGSLLGSLIAGNLDDGLFRFTNILTGNNAVRFFGNNYQTIYIGTNGIISFGTFDPQLGVNIEPPTDGLSQNNMLNAILPLWKDFNFGDADVTGRSLCIKVTSNEIIITFSKVPSYNASVDANDYVSFQTILQYTSNPVQNSKIDFVYNYDQTGSSFVSKYNNNTIYPMLVGIKGTSESAQEFQYRFFNSSFQLINSGPIFSSNLTLALGPDASLLPVELSSFTSQVNGSNVKLEWSTVNEQNNSGFDVERKTSGSNEWKKISFVNGNGTSNETHNYSYEDKIAASGKYQYRLKQIDFNGNYKYYELSNEVEIEVPKKFNLSQNYPNPFNPATKINFELPRSSNVKLSVYDITGKLASELVNEQRAAGYYTVEFNGSNFASGIYFYRIEAGEYNATKKMTLVK